MEALIAYLAESTNVTWTHGEYRMKHSSIIVRAEWDDEARVWVASSSDIAGLSIEAATIEALEPKVLAAIEDLLELNGEAFDLAEIPVHFMAQLVARVTNPRH